jgi:16S rRNA (guanine966-N2)-methyltransferase
VTLVERNREAAQACKENLEKVRAGLRAAQIDCRLLMQVRPAESYLKQASDVSLVFLDPPYDITNQEITKILGGIIPMVKCLIVLERRSQDPAPEIPKSVDLLRSTLYGDTVVFLLTKGVAP